MSGVAILLALLTADAAPKPVPEVPDARIKGGVLPQGLGLPAIGVTEVSSIDRNIINPMPKLHVVERTQITVLATNYAEQKLLIKRVRAACRDRRGTIAGFEKVVVTTGVTGPDQLGGATGIFMQTQDFRVSFLEVR